MKKRHIQLVIAICAVALLALFLVAYRRQNSPIGEWTDGYVSISIRADGTASGRDAEGYERESPWHTVGNRIVFERDLPIAGPSQARSMVWERKPEGLVLYTEDRFQTYILRPKL